MLRSGRAKIVATNEETDFDAQLFTPTRCSGSTYPMMVMRLDKVLTLTKLETHQTYLRRGDIVAYTEGMQVIFGSHEWLARGHPDPHMDQFRVLQEVFGPDGLVAGCPASVDPYWADAMSGSARTPLKKKHWKSFLKDPTKVFLFLKHIFFNVLKI
jgi:hypothetical protein